jgi:hypothetical protein
MCSIEQRCKLLGLESTIKERTNELMKQWIIEHFWNDTDRRNREIEKQPVRAPLCSPKFPHALTRERTWLPRGKWPTTHWDMARRPWIVEPCGRSSMFRSSLMLPPSGYILSSEMSLTSTIIIWCVTQRMWPFTFLTSRLVMLTFIFRLSFLKISVI